jgi:hypothetical protein
MAPLNRTADLFARRPEKKELTVLAPLASDRIIDGRGQGPGWWALRLLEFGYLSSLSGVS